MKTIHKQRSSHPNLIAKRAKRYGLASSLVILVTFLGTFNAPADALTLINERAKLGGNDFLDWSSLGKVFNPFNPNPADFLANSFSAASFRGMGVAVDIALPPAPPPFITPPFVFQTLPLPLGIPTNFAFGDFVLFTGLAPINIIPTPGNPGPLTLTFDEPVWAVGTQVAVDDATAPYTVFLSAFDRDDNLLGNFSVMGTSSTNLDNSALFLGVSSDTQNIAKLVYSSSVPGKAFGINNLSLVISVPEPSSTVGLLVLGMVGALLKWKSLTRKP